MLPGHVIIKGQSGDWTITINDRDYPPMVKHSDSPASGPDMVAEYTDLYPFHLVHLR